MSRSIRIVLSLGAVLALASVGSASASAEVLFHSEIEKTFGAGEQTTQVIYTTNAGTIKCTEVKGTGVMSGKTASSITINQSISGCTAFGQAAEWSMNGCQYVAKSNGEGVIQCPVGSEIVIKLKTAGCTVKTPAQTVKGIATYVNKGSGSTRSVEATLHGEGLTYVSSGGICGSSGTNGKVSGALAIKGFKDEAHTTQVGIWVE